MVNAWPKVTASMGLSSTVFHVYAHQLDSTMIFSASPVLNATPLEEQSLVPPVSAPLHSILRPSTAFLAGPTPSTMPISVSANAMQVSL